MKKNFYFLNQNVSNGLFEDFLIPAQKGVGDNFFATLNGIEHSQIELNDKGWILVSLTEEKAEVLIEIDRQLRLLENQFNVNSNLAKAG